MMKVTTAEIIRQLVSRGVFTEKKDAEYQVGIKNEQIVVNKNGSAEIAYLGNTLESVIQLADMFKKVGTKEQQKQINAALADLVTITEMKHKTDWLVAIVCSEVIAAGIICITMLGYYFWRLFL